jgi:thioredoxin-dependent peroxiredoxin
VVNVGEMAPDFEGTTADGTRLRLAAFRGRTVVVYFYPKARSYGCTQESKAFAELEPELKQRNAEVVGISVDDAENQRRFADECRLPFPLVADADRSIARAYGVLGAFGLARRVTFVIDPEGRVQQITTGLMPGPHVRAVREHLLGST